MMSGMEFCLLNINWGVVATLMAVAVALAAPYLAAGIDRRRRGIAALGLAETAFMALTAATNRTVSLAEVDERLRASAELDLSAISEAMARIPPDHLGDPRAIDAFVRLQGNCRRAVSVLMDDQPLNVTQATKILTDMPTLLGYATEHVETLRRLLPPR